MPFQWTKKTLLAQVKEMDWTLSQAQVSEPWNEYLHDFSLPDRTLAEHFVGKVKSAGFELCVQVWQGKTVEKNALLVHGLYDHVGLYRHLIRHCLEQNYRVIAFDLPGHGLSSGAQASIDDFDQYQEVLADMLIASKIHFTEPLHAFGQSTGGGILLHYLLTQPRPVLERVNLIAPLIRPYEWRKIQFLLPLLKRFVRQLKRGQSHNSQDQEFLNLVWHTDPLQAKSLNINWVIAVRRWWSFIEAQLPCSYPIEVVQGDNDHSVAWQHNLAVLKRLFPKAKVHKIAGAGHHLVNELEPMRAQMWQCFD